MKFTGKIKIIGVNPYVLVSKTRATQLQKGWRKPMPVLVKINNTPDDGEPWRLNMMPVGDGSFYLYLHGAMRKISNTGVGDVVEVDVIFNGAYQGGPEHPIPEWFEAALDKSAVAKANWDVLPPSRQKEVVRYFVGLKSDEAKQRNLKKAMQALSGEPTRFMARDWDNGS